MKRIKIIETLTIIFIFAIVIGLIYLWTASPLGTNDKVGITMAISTGALVVITGIYAYYTQKMAEEMRDTRHDTVRPVIDFQWQDPNEPNIIVNSFALNEGIKGKVPTELSCKLRNVGFGPAIELYSYTKVGQDIVRHDFEQSLEAGGKTENWVALSVRQEGSMGVLEACYKDIYGFDHHKSKLEVYPIMGKGLQTKLKIEKVREEHKI